MGDQLALVLSCKHACTCFHACCLLATIVPPVPDPATMPVFPVWPCQRQAQTCLGDSHVLMQALEHAFVGPSGQGQGQAVCAKHRCMRTCSLQQAATSSFHAVVPARACRTVNTSRAPRRAVKAEAHAVL